MLTLCDVAVGGEDLQRIAQFFQRFVDEFNVAAIGAVAKQFHRGRENFRRSGLRPPLFAALRSVEPPGDALRGASSARRHDAAAGRFLGLFDAVAVKPAKFVHLRQPSVSTPCITTPSLILGKTCTAANEGSGWKAIMRRGKTASARPASSRSSGCASSSIQCIFATDGPSAA